MTKNTGAIVWTTAALLLSGIPGVVVPAGAQAQQNNMSFFVTSTGIGKGADLGGLEGADRHCQQLAQAAGAGNRTWHAYLSTQPAEAAPPSTRATASAPARGATPRASSSPTISTSCTATTS